MTTNAVITGWGMYAPSRVLTNDELSKIVDTSDEWIVSAAPASASVASRPTTRRRTPCPCSRRAMRWRSPGSTRSTSTS